MKIINTSDKDYSWTWDGGNYGPLAPGEIMDLPPEIALHAVKRSAILDELGELLGFKIELLDSVKRDPDRLKMLVSYKCPYIESGECNHEPFKNVDDLRVHLETHWGTTPVSVGGQKQKASASPRA